MEKILILGAGGFASEVFYYLRETFEVSRLFFYSHFGERNYLNRPVFQSPNEVRTNYRLITGVRNPNLNQSFVSELTFPGLSYISKFSHIADRDSFILGEGSIICPGSILTIDIRIGHYSKIHVNTSIGHNTRIGNFSNIAPGCNISGNVNIGDCCEIGTGASIREKISICNDVTVGMGAIVIKNIDEPGVYIGTPAKLLRKTK